MRNRKCTPQIHTVFYGTFLKTQEYPLDEKIVFECKGMKLSDPHDRIIVATAKLLQATLITKDEKIAASSLVETIW